MEIISDNEYFDARYMNKSDIKKINNLIKENAGIYIYDYSIQIQNNEFKYFE
jgi:hypothetical protein